MTTIKGAKKGQGSQRKAVIAPDSAQSKTFLKILYGLSEGQVKGLTNGYKSVYLDDTPLQDANGNWNFQNVQVDFRHGTNDQTYIEGFPSVEAETGIGVELKSDAAWVQAFSNTELDAVRVRLKWGPIRQTNPDNGDITGYTIKYAIDVQTDGGAWVESINTQLSDKTSANYERSHRIDLPKADTGWQIRIRRITPNSTSEYISDKMYVQAVTEIIDAKLRYPNTALLGLQYDAETFSNVAKIAIEMDGVEIRVPTNYDPVTRTYVGLWDGTFKRAYTNNPAWHFYDTCISKRYALGDRINSSMIDKWSVYRIAQYCDQLVSDGKGGQEPRFTLNVYEQQQDDAWSALSKMAGAFRAFIYWDGQAIVCDADIPQDTHFTYTHANVISGHFEYSGTRARDRHTVAKVAWDNPSNRYKTENVIVRDEAAISKLGIRIVDIKAYGCTSEGQAQRAGQWALKSEQLETRTVSFKVGLDGFIPMPGKVIEIADELFAGRSNGGRISAVSSDRKTITLDREDVICRAGDRLVVNGEDGKAQARIVSSKVGRNVTVTVAFDSVAAQNIWVVDAQDLATMKFRVISITQDEKHQFSITALQYNPQKYDAIDHGAFIDERPISIVNPTTQAPVTDVLISSETMVQQGLLVTTMVISWTQASGATKYQVEWRKDDGTWIKMPITGNNSVEVQGIYSGNYEARVTAISAFDVASLPTYSMITALSGKQGLPPDLANITATGILFGYRLDWNFPATGALDTAYTEIEIASTADGANAAQLGLFAYPTNSHVIQGMQPNLTRYFRGRLIDRIGNIGPWSQYVSATTSADASAVLDILSGKLTETQLHQDLQTEIAKIDENAIAISQETFARAAAIASEAQLRATAISTEKTERQSADNNLSQQIDTVSASTANNTAAIQAEQTARSNADSSLASQITAVAATANAKNKTYRQSTAPTTGMTAGDLWFNTADNNKPYRYSGSTWVATEDTRIAANTAAITNEATARANADSALTTQINTALSQVDNAKSLIITEQQTRADADIALGSRIDTLQAQVGDDLQQSIATIQQELDVLADADSALSSRVDTLQAQTNDKLASAQTQLTALTTQQGVMVSRVDILQTTVNGNTASIQTVSESVDGLYAQKYIKLDVNGKVAGWGGANDGIESNFILNFDSFAIGSGNSTAYYPFIFRPTAYTDPNTDTVFPVGAYLKSAFIDYASIDTAHIKQLAVKSAQIDDLAVTTGKIDNLAVTTGKIDNLAVTTGKIADLQVNTLKIAYGSVTNGALTTSLWSDTGNFLVDAANTKKVLSWVQMKGRAGSVSGGSFCEIWLMRGNTELSYRKFTTEVQSNDPDFPTSYRIDINDFFMIMDTPTETGTVNYWVKMRTYAYNQSEHTRIQNAMRCEWMLLEAKR